MKRLKHPKHGWAFAQSEAEEWAMKARGWGDDDDPPLAQLKLAAALAKAAAPQEKTDPEVSPGIPVAPVGAAPAKRGRPRKA